MNQQEQERITFNVHDFEQNKDEIRQSEFVDIPEIKDCKLHELKESQKENIQPQIWDKERVDKKLQKLVNFIKFHNVDQNLIWKYRKEVSIKQFTKFMNENYAYALSNEQLLALLSITIRKQFLTTKDFQRFDIWRNSTQSSSRFLSDYGRKKTEKQNLKRVINVKDTKNTATWLDETKISSQQNSKLQFHIHKPNVKFSIKPRRDFYQESFDEAKKYSEAKLRLKVQELKKDIKQSVLEKKWDFIVMAGQMNQWIEQLKKEANKLPNKKKLESIFSYCYKVVNKDPVEIIQENVDLKTEELVPHVVFVKKYQTLKKRMVKEENNKNNLKGTVLMVLEDNDKLNKNNLVNRINQRDQELNFVLLQIMRMKSLFQWQNGILKQAKINS